MQKRFIGPMAVLMLAVFAAPPALARPSRVEFEKIAGEKEAEKQSERDTLKAAEQQAKKEGRSLSYQERVKLKKSDREDRKKKRLFQSQQRTERVGLGRTRTLKVKEQEAKEKEAKKNGDGTGE